jgi:hypothetical protein
MATTLTIERVMAFMGLDVLVARDEGLCTAEGIDLRVAALPPEAIRSAAEGESAMSRPNSATAKDIRRHATMSRPVIACDVPRGPPRYADPPILRPNCSSTTSSARRR